MPFIIILFGFLAASFALIFEFLTMSLLSFSDQTLFTSLLFSFDGILSLKTFFILLGIVCIEESSKYIFLRQYANRFFTRIESTFKNSLFLGVFFGLGFSLLEFFFLINTSEVRSLFPIFGTAFVHTLTSVAFALFLFPDTSKNWLNRGKFSTLSLLFIAILFHMVYNLMALLLF